jgi:hypothetical protein
MDVIDGNETFRKYDYSSVIKQADIDHAISDIKSIIESGNYWTNSPKYQTKENLFARQHPVWMKFRMSFLFSVFQYFGSEVKVGKMQAWSFMTNNESEEDRETLWHHHQHVAEPQMFSGIFYLSIPNDVENRDLCGTEFAPNGPKGEGKFHVKPADFHWLVYPSRYWHRPAAPQSNKYRFIIAADVEIH